MSKDFTFTPPNFSPNFTPLDVKAINKKKREDKERERRFQESQIELTPSTQVEAVETKANTEAALPTHPLKFVSKYKARDDDFRAWINEVKPSHKNMIKADIHRQLMLRNCGLWSSGFENWWKKQKIHKGQSGRKKKLI